MDGTPYKTLSEFVDTFITLRGEVGATNKYWYLNVARQGLKELWEDVNGEPEFATLPVENGIAHLPKDYVKFIRVGISNGERLLSLYHDRTLIGGKMTTDCGEPISQTQTTLSIYNPITQHTNEFGENTGRSYGKKPIPRTGYFNILPQKGIIVVTNTGGYNISHVVLEYLSRVKTVDGEYVVHPYIEKALENYLLWNMVRYKKNGSTGERVQREREYYAAKQTAKIKMANITADALRHTWATNNTFIK